MAGQLEIVLVDDDPEYHEIFRDYIQLALAENDYHLACFDDRTEALQALDQSAATAVFVDYRMGAATGIEFIRDCHVAGVSAPFILLTGFDTLSAERDALAIGAFDYLSKDDVRPTMLSRCIRHATNTLMREEELRAALRQAQIAIEARQQFLGNMSHEMRTPLNGIIGFAELLVLRNGGQHGKVEEYAKGIRESGYRLLELVEGLLSLVEQSSSQKLDNRPTAMAEIIPRICARYRSMAAARNIDFDIELQKSGLRVLVDRELLAVAIRPLVDNAVKFAEAGNHVTVSVDLDDDLNIAIADDGPGMPRAVAEDVMAPFVLTESYLTRSHGGAGIGLSVARNAVAALGGRMKIVSEPGEGTSISVQIPVTLTAEPELMRM